MSYVSAAEAAIGGSLSELAALGQPIRELVENEAQAAEGDYARVLDMALARLGERERIVKVAAHLRESPSPTIRVCACLTLRQLKDRSAIPALREALRDPCHRQDGACLRIGDGKIYPVRIIASDALIELGEDPKEIRALLQEQGK